VTVLVTAVLLIQSLYRLQQERLGFRPQGLLAFSTPLAPAQRRSPATVLSPRFRTRRAKWSGWLPIPKRIR
jgi:hypothetical protein